MELRNKNGFITVYAMLSMMFFVVIVTTASITASRKLNLQKEANSELLEIYNDSIGDIDQTAKMTIPIYTQAQFEQIADWLEPLTDGDESTAIEDSEYIYVNDLVYSLSSDKYPKINDNGTPEDSSDDNEVYLKFELKTDLWFDGTVNTDTTDKNDYPYIPNESKYHRALKEMKSRNEDFKQGHIIHIKTEQNEYEYGVTVIPIYNAEDFLRIGTDYQTGDLTFSNDKTYEIRESFEINVDSQKIMESINSRKEKGPFKGKITTQSSETDVIIKGLKIDLSGIENSSDYLGFIPVLDESGVIENITFTDVEIIGDDKTSIRYFGILVGQNDNGTIRNCNITISNKNSCQININNGTIANFGITAGVNSGTIQDCGIAATNIVNVNFQNLGLIAGTNSGTIKNITINKCELGASGNKLSGMADFTIGGVCGQNTGTVGDSSNHINITELNIYSGDSGSNEYVAGVVGENKNSSSYIYNVKLNNININPDATTYRVGGIVARNYGSISNVSAIGSITNGTDVGLVCGENNGSITSATANGTTYGSGNVGLICGKNNEKYTDANGSQITPTISNVTSAIGSITGGTNVGLICGSNAGTLTNISAVMASGGTVTGTASDANVAIICGLNSGTISTVNSAQGTISGGVNRGIVCGQNANTGSITNVTEAIGVIDGGTNVGLICGSNAGTVTNVSAAMANGGTVRGTDNVAIICGYNSGSIENVISAIGTVSGGTQRGLVCGENSGQISTVRGVNGTIISGAEDAGLICGLNSNKSSNNTTLSENPIYDVQANGTIEGGVDVGLVCGENQGGISNVVVTGIINSGTDVGGVAGYNDDLIKNVNVNAAINGSNTGGIVGNVSVNKGDTNKTILENCYSNVLISNSSSTAGGIVGNAANAPVEISNCAYVNNISASCSNIGGLVGYMANNVTISNCYMNGKIPTDYGAIIGTKASGTLRLNTALYNQAYPWKTNATDWSGTPKKSGDGSTLKMCCEGLKDEITARIDEDLKYRYIKIKINEVKSGSLIQLSEWRFFKDSNDVYLWDDNDKNGITVGGSTDVGNSGEKILEIIDNRINSNGDASGRNKYCNTFTGPQEIIIDLGDGDYIDLNQYVQYTYYTGDDSNDYPERSPVSWEISFSNDKEKWILFDYREKINPNTGSYIQAGTWGL